MTAASILRAATCGLPGAVKEPHFPALPVWGSMGVGRGSLGPAPQAQADHGAPSCPEQTKPRERGPSSEGRAKGTLLPAQAQNGDGRGRQSPSFPSSLLPLSSCSESQVLGGWSQSPQGNALSHPNSFRAGASH